MGHFAKVQDLNGEVVQVIVAEQSFIDSGSVDETGYTWVKTSYNTQGNVHSRGKAPLRKNFAGKGFTYNKDKDAFIAPQPYPSWTLVEATCQWEAPVAYPIDDKKYTWNEDTTNWVEVVE